MSYAHSPDPIADQAFCELMISCEIGDCLNLLQTCLDEPATDPVEAWAERMAHIARERGWRVSDAGRVVCLEHIS